MHGSFDLLQYWCQQGTYKQLCSPDGQFWNWSKFHQAEILKKKFHEQETKFWEKQVSQLVVEFVTDALMVVKCFLVQLAPLGGQIVTGAGGAIW